jgi:ribosomal protein L7/L12
MTAKQLSPELRSKVIKLILKGRKVQAVKVVQEATKWGLKNSKDSVDAIIEELKK